MEFCVASCMSTLPHCKMATSLMSEWDDLVSSGHYCLSRIHHGAAVGCTHLAERMAGLCVCHPVTLILTTIKQGVPWISSFQSWEKQGEGKPT